MVAVRKAGGGLPPPPYSDDKLADILRLESVAD